MIDGYDVLVKTIFHLRNLIGFFYYSRNLNFLEILHRIVTDVTK